MAKRRIGRVLLIVIALLVVLPAAALAIFAATFDPNRYKPQIAEAVKRATGRDLGAERTAPGQAFAPSDDRGEPGRAGQH